MSSSRLREACHICARHVLYSAVRPAGWSHHNAIDGDPMLSRSDLNRVRSTITGYLAFTLKSRREDVTMKGDRGLTKFAQSSISHSSRNKGCRLELPRLRCAT